MFSSLWIKSTLTLLVISLIVMGSCRMMKMAGCGKRKRRPPKIITAGPYPVSSVDTGATLNVATGRRGKRTRQVILQGVAAPAEGEWWASESRDHLQQLAGRSVTVQYEKRGLFRQINPDDSQLNGEKAENEEWNKWYNEHVESCSYCRGSNKGLPSLCEEAFEKSQEILRRDMVEIDCFVCNGTGKIEYPADPALSRPKRIDACYRCSGDGKWWTSNPEEQQRLLKEKIEARGPLIGIAFGESGINLNVAQIEGGYARCNSESPGEWKELEEAAKKNRFGVWSEEDTE